MSASSDLACEHAAPISESIKVAELLLVLAVAFGSAVFRSIYVNFIGASHVTNPDVGFQLTQQIISEAAAIAVLVYVLFRQTRDLRSLGLTVHIGDVPMSIALSIGGYVVYWGCLLSFFYLYL